MRFYLFFFLLGYNLLQAQPTILPPPQTDEIIIDNGAAGKADPNDRIRYKVTIQNTGTNRCDGNATQYRTGSQDHLCGRYIQVFSIGITGQLYQHRQCGYHDPCGLGFES